mmetsp:Transcript_386/g.795  ORF Transcript_386/g.795 Transcript_386/m.795 type:complete len:132 (-) Transcript_386:672-1067(-)
MESPLTIKNVEHFVSLQEKGTAETNNRILHWIKESYDFESTSRRTKFLFCIPIFSLKGGIKSHQSPREIRSEDCSHQNSCVRSSLISIRNSNDGSRTDLSSNLDPNANIVTKKARCLSFPKAIHTCLFKAT